MSMQGKVIAITGGASGIGLATAKLLSSRGAIVCIVDSSPSALESTTAYFNTLEKPFAALKLDVTSSVEVQAWIKTILERYGHLDGAVNCAGIVGKKHGATKLTETEDDEWFQIINVNLTGLMHCLREELRTIVNGGSIVNVSSIQGVMGFPGSAAYSASKHGIIGLTRSVAKEVGDREIRVNVVAPGTILTPLLVKAWEANPDEGKDTNTAIKRIGTPEEIATIIAFLLSPESSFVTGAVYSGDGGWNC